MLESIDTGPNPREPCKGILVDDWLTSLVMEPCIINYQWLDCTCLHSKRTDPPPGPEQWIIGWVEEITGPAESDNGEKMTIVDDVLQIDKIKRALRDARALNERHLGVVVLLREEDGQPLQ